MLTLTKIYAVKTGQPRITKVPNYGEGLSRKAECYMLNAELEFFIMLHLSVFSAFNSSFNIQNSTFSIP